MFDDINRAGKMVQERLNAIPPDKLLNIVTNVSYITNDVRDIVAAVKRVVLKLESFLEVKNGEL